MKLTLTMLNEMGACYAAREAFTEEFGREAEVSEVVAALHQRGAIGWEAWLLGQNDPILVKALLDNGADVHACDDHALHVAACYGYLDTVKLLIRAGADVNEALRWAAYNGHLDVVRLLVKAGADVHAREDEALRWAVEKGHTAVADFLKSKMTK